MAVILSSFAATANTHTIVFDGDNDMYGLTRQTTLDVNSLTFVQDFSFTESGINFSLKKASETGNGFALVNAGGNNAGIYVYSGFSTASAITPEITLTVPGGKISAAKLFLSGTNNAGLNTLGVNFNSAEIEAEKDGSLFYWAWTDAEGIESLTITWKNIYYARFIHSIELTYTEDLGGKQESGLSFSETVAEGVLGEEFVAPAFSNPNNLELTWSSSDDKVAAVSSAGEVTLVGIGKTVISVSTPGNDIYAAGNASYDLTVIPAADNIAQLKEFAPELYDRVKVNFPATVTFANGNFAFVVDADGTPACFEDIRNQGSTSTTAQTLYKVGQVIPAGWVATNATIYSSVIWQGVPPKVVETVDVEYPVVESVTPADADRVVTLKAVTFTTPTASETTKAYGTTPDGTSYEFQDTYNAPQKPAGTYDVTAVVRYSQRGSTVYFYLAPIAYAESGDAGISEIETDQAPALYYNLQGLPVTDPRSGIYIKVTNGHSSKILLK